MQFKCPYCFEEIQDDQVHFRSERVSNQGDNPIMEYDDLESFELQYTGRDKEEKKRKYIDWEFFLQVEDKKYKNYWSEFGGTTEKNTVYAERAGITEYYRRVIVPVRDRKYIRLHGDNGDLFIRDQGMVVAVELITGERCTSRVCPHCHNPLPTNYGLYDTKFITMVGVSGAGKTVYLSQLLREIQGYLANIGLALLPTTMATNDFISRNIVRRGIPLPGSTPLGSFEQPLCFQLMIDQKNHGVRKHTLVLYDVAGEALQDVQVVDRFIRFIRHADGIIYLTAPEQFEGIAAAMGNEKRFAPEAALNVIYNLLKEEKGGRIPIPVAATISKVDSPIVLQAMRNVPGDFTRVTQAVEPVQGERKQVFNAEDYNILGESLTNFMKRNAQALDMALRTSFENYLYFAVTSLGCECKELNENGRVGSCPVAEPHPMRIEEPLYWLLYRFGYIGVNTVISLPNTNLLRCPCCDRTIIKDYDIDQDTQFSKIDRIFSFINKEYKEKRNHNKRCERCGHTWEIQG